MLAQNLRRLRKQKGVTQAELSSRLGLTQQAVARWENDKSEPDARNLNWLADFYGVTVDYLLGRESGGSSVDEEEARFLKIYRELSGLYRQKLEDLAATFLLAQAK